MKRLLLFSTYSLAALAILAAAAYFVYRSRYSADTIQAVAEICDNGIDDNGNGKIDECWDPGGAYSVSGKTYYVATTGNDSNEGTEAAPFKTFAKAAGLAAAGDGIFITSGTYNENLVMVNAGTPDKPIIIKGIGATKPIIRSNNDIARIIPKSNTIIDNIKTDGIATVTNAGHGLGGYGVWVYEANNILVNNCEFTQHERAVFGERGDRLIVRNSKAYKTEWGFMVGRDDNNDTAQKDYFTNTLFENDEAADTAYANFDNTDGFGIEGRLSHHTIRNCTSHGFSDAGYDIKTPVLIENSVAWGNKQNGFKLWRDGIVRNSIAYSNSYSNYLFGGLSPNWKLANSVSNGSKVVFEKRSASSPLLSSATVKVSHNIFYNSPITDEIGGVAAQGDHNIFFNAGYSSPPEKSSKIADPGFTDLSANNYTLKSTSPAINAGSASLAEYMSQTDFSGKSRLSGPAVDIGPYELQSQISSPSCSDGIKNGNETGIDCGGSCDLCEDANQPPIFTSASTFFVNAGKELSFVATAKDPEGQAITISAISLPGRSTFIDNKLSYTPNKSAHGTVRATLRATDSGGKSTDQIVTIKILASVSTIEKRQLKITDEGNGEIIAQVCRNPLYTNRYIEILGYGDGSNFKLIRQAALTTCSSTFTHRYESAGEYQVTLYLCEKDSSGNPTGCFPNLAKRYNAK